MVEGPQTYAKMTTLQAATVAQVQGLQSTNHLTSQKRHQWFRSAGRVYRPSQPECTTRTPSTKL